MLEWNERNVDRTDLTDPLKKRIKELEQENHDLREINLGLAERVVGQSELLSQRSERVVPLRYEEDYSEGGIPK